jgi:hypothetical protein
MAFTSPEFPGRSFNSMQEFEQAVKEKKRIQLNLRKGRVTTIVEAEGGTTLKKE